MVALDERFISTSDLEEVLFDRNTRLPLSDGLIYFYSADAPNVLKPVYQLADTFPTVNYVPLPNPMTLSAIGNTQNAGGDNVTVLYFPYDGTPDNSQGNLELYYIVVTDSAGTVQFTRNPWPLLTSANTPTQQTDNHVINQISNPQFSNVFINEDISTVYSVTAATFQEFIFSPDWTFVISGTGTVTIQRIPISGSQHVPTSPPYVLEVNASVGITLCHLRQRFSKNSGLWTTTSINNQVFLYGSYVAQNQLAGSTSIGMFYQESSGVNFATPVAIIDNTQQFTNPYEVVKGSTAAFIPSSSNTDSGEAGFIDVYLDFPIPCDVRFSSIQLIPSEIAPTNIVLPDFDSSNRNEAFQGDYYIPRAAAKQIDSYLTGWDFPLNPFQFGASGTIRNIPILPTEPYICDQTIAFCNSVGNVTWVRDPVTSGLKFTATSVNDAFYIQQYLTGSQVKDMLGNRMSVNVFAYQNITPPSNPVTIRVYLFRADAGTLIPTLPAFLGTLTTGGVFSPTVVGWKEIPRSGLPTAQATLNNVQTSDQINNPANDYGFTGWQITEAAEISATDKFCIVVTFAYLGLGIPAPPSITVNSISVVPGDLPCRPAVKTFSETLALCQYYYEKSYNVNVVPGANTPIGALLVHQLGIYASGPTAYRIFPLTISVRYKLEKRIAVTPSLFSIDGTPSDLFAIIYSASASRGSANVTISSWTLTDLGSNSFVMTANNLDAFIFSNVTAQVGINIEAYVKFHYVSDARLALV